MRLAALLVCLVSVSRLVAQEPEAVSVIRVPRILRNLDYGGKNNKRQMLDLYLPPMVQGADKSKPPQLVVWIHGGAWLGGSKRFCQVRWLIQHNFALASINYRLSQEAIFPAQIHDCKAAIRWLRGNQQKYRYDAKKIAVAGASAGGHLAALLGTSVGVRRLEGTIGRHLKQSSRVHAVVDLYGPTDFLQMDTHAIRGSVIVHDDAKSPESRLIGGPIQENKQKVANANPVTFVDKADPPFLILHGDMDRLVPSHQSLLLANALKKQSVAVEIRILRGAGHGGRRFDSSGNRQRMLKFLKKHLK